jgi:hypothetical protein
MIRKIKPSRRSEEKFKFFSQCEDVLRLPPTDMCLDGESALVCFHAKETYGETLPCCEPGLLDRALNGKEQHGMTVTMVAEDYIDRLIFACEIEKNYPDWVANEIYARANQLALEKVGFIPTFVSKRRDFTTNSSMAV